MKIAILGLGQAGKKTLFTLLTGRSVPPTVKPGEAIEGSAAIKDSRVDALSDFYNPEKTTYAENQFVLCPDIADSGTSRLWMDPAQRCDLLCLLSGVGPSQVSVIKRNISSKGPILGLTSPFLTSKSSL